jgi:hypothetical protein
MRGTAVSSLKMDYIPSHQYMKYSARIDIPLTFSLYYCDISAILSSFYTDEFDIPGKNSENKFIIEQGYSYITGRFGPGENFLYKLINSFELEWRWYILRPAVPASKMFMSVFGNIGLCVNKNNEDFFVYQAGMGFGYNLFDTVPFTFQAGLDNHGNIIFYAGIVSRISHRP